MKIKKLDINKKENRIKFLIEDTTPEFANLLRRAIIDRVPVLAVDEVEFKENDSVLYDEIIAHRLAMIPLTTDLKSYTYKENCKCDGEGCARCTCQLSLKEKGPKMVYASDIKSNDAKVKPAYPKIPIVKLRKEQKLEFVATATLDVGIKHIKWSPGTAWYSYYPEVKVKHNDKLFKKFKDKFPPQAIKNNKLDKNKIEENELYDACDGICEDLVKIDWQEDKIIFNVESWGQLSPKEMVLKGCEIMNEHLDKFSEQIK